MYLCIVRSRRATLRISARILRFSIRNELVYQIAINIASYRSGNETSKADIDTVHSVLATLTYLLGFAFG